MNSAATLYLGSVRTQAAQPLTCAEAHKYTHTHTDKSIFGQWTAIQGMNDKAIDLSAMVRWEREGADSSPILGDLGCHFTLLLIFTRRHSKVSIFTYIRAEKHLCYHLGPTQLYEDGLTNRSCRKYNTHTQKEERKGQSERWLQSQIHKSRWKDTWLSFYLSVPLSEYRRPCVMCSRVSLSLLWWRKGKTGAWSN